jgi:hypothetical protein
MTLAKNFGKNFKLENPYAAKFNPNLMETMETEENKEENNSKQRLA